MIPLWLSNTEADEERLTYKCGELLRPVSTSLQYHYRSYVNFTIDQKHIPWKGNSTKIYHFGVKFFFVDLVLHAQLLAHPTGKKVEDESTLNVIDQEFIDDLPEDEPVEDTENPETPNTSILDRDYFANDREPDQISQQARQPPSGSMPAPQATEIRGGRERNTENTTSGTSEEIPGECEAVSRSEDCGRSSIGSIAISKGIPFQEREVK